MTRNPITAPCSLQYMPAARQSGARADSAITQIVLHDTEGGTAPSIARYFQSPAAGGSAHLVVDDDSCYRSLANSIIPWGAPGANEQGLHIEHCGYASWTRVQWCRHIRMLRRSAWKSAKWCRRYGIPARYLTAADLREGKAGITTHRQVSLAFGKSDHTDPGAHFPIYLYIMLVRYYIRRQRAL